MLKRKPTKKTKSNKSESSNSNSPLRKNSNDGSAFKEFMSYFTAEDLAKVSEVSSAILGTERTFSIDDMIDIWSRGMTNGATLWQYCQDNGYTLPSSFEAGTLELVNEVRSSKDKAGTLQHMINNNMLLVGVFTEKH